jgi:hypothetical protein
MVSRVPTRNHCIKKRVRFILNEVDNRSILTQTPSSLDGRPGRREARLSRRIPPRAPLLILLSSHGWKARSGDYRGCDEQGKVSMRMLLCKCTNSPSQFLCFIGRGHARSMESQQSP